MLATCAVAYNARKAFPQNWYELSIGTARAYISCTVLMSTTGRLGCELYIPGRQQTDFIFEALAQNKAVIEEQLGALDWQDLPDRKACRIADYKHPVNFDAREDWPPLYGWLKDRAEAFKAVFAQRIKDIELPELPQPAPSTQGAEV